MGLDFGNFKKWVLGIVGTIFLGALGSGIWDWVLSDFFLWLGATFISTASNFSQSFVNSLYKDVWKGSSFPYLREVYILTFVIYLSIPILFSIMRRHIMEKEKGSEKEEIRKEKFFISAIVLCAVGVMLTIKIWQTSFTERVSSTLQANISIVSPHLTSDKRLELSAKYSLINSEVLAIELRDDLTKLAESNNLKLHYMGFM